MSKIEKEAAIENIQNEILSVKFSSDPEKTYKHGLFKAIQIIRDMPTEEQK